jgi:NADH-quinone oxidoreductase subunit J
MLSLGVLYLLLGGEFIAAVQVIVYAGAIMVLFVFVIMLLNAGAEKKIIREKPLMATVVGLPVLFGFAGILAWIIQSRMPFTAPVKFGQFTGGTARDVGRYLFTRGLLPFEVTSLLILIAIMGALVLAQKEID